MKKVGKTLILYLQLVLFLLVFQQLEVQAEEYNPTKVTTNKSTEEILLEMWSYVPVDIIESFIEDGWQVKLVEDCGELYGDELGMRQIQAVTDSRCKTIFINNNEADIRSSLIHEVGHYVDWKLKIISNSTEFNRVYELERKQFRYTTQGNSTWYAVSTSIEYFAEAFQQVILNGSGLACGCPDTYGFVGTVAFDFISLIGEGYE